MNDQETLGASRGRGVIGPTLVAVVAVALVIAALGTLRGAAQADAAAPAPVAAMSQDTAAAPAAQPVAAAPAVTEPAVAPAESAGSAPAEAEPAAEAITVRIADMAYSPATLEVNVGDTVTWINDDSVPHDVVTSSGPATMESETLEQGESFSYTFESAGTYEYYCSIHPDMTGSVTVTDSGGGSGGDTGGGSGGGHEGGHEGGGDDEGDGGETCTSGLVNGTLDPTVKHLYSAHLERSPGEQVGDALKTDEYVKAHTVWLGQVAKPTLDAVPKTLEGVDPVVKHLYSAHLERSPGEQVSDALKTDEYLKTHTVWLGQVAKPGVQAATGTC